jgi:hypothetical protein
MRNSNCSLKDVSLLKSFILEDKYLILDVITDMKLTPKNKVNIMTNKDIIVFGLKSPKPIVVNVSML